MTRDAALALHTAATLAFVLAVDLCVVLGLAALLSPWLGPVLDAAAGSGPAGVALRLVPLAIATLALGWAQLRYARRRLLAEVDATAATPESHPELLARVTRLASQGDAETPSVAVADTPVANSFTVGGPRTATLVVSTGLLDALDGDELDAVLAHELAHITNRDALVLTLAAFLPALARGSAWAGTGADRPSAPSASDGGVGRYVLLAVGLLVLYVLSLPRLPGAGFGPASLAAFGVGLALTALLGGVALGVAAAATLGLARRLSRRREFVADRAGARTVGSPAAMAAALRRLDDPAGGGVGTDAGTGGTPGPDDPAPEIAGARGVPGAGGVERATGRAVDGPPERERSDVRPRPAADLRSSPVVDPVAGLCFLPGGFDGTGRATASSADPRDRTAGSDSGPEPDPLALLLRSRAHPRTAERVARLRRLEAER